jgi:hypothetical protein
MIFRNTSKKEVDLEEELELIKPTKKEFTKHYIEPKVLFCDLFKFFFSTLI